MPRTSARVRSTWGSDGDDESEAARLARFTEGAGGDGRDESCVPLDGYVHTAGDVRLCFRNLEQALAPSSKLLMNMCADRAGRRLFVFGGMASASGLFVYHIESNTWTRKNVVDAQSGAVLDVKVNSSCFHFHHGHLMLFGGFGWDRQSTAIMDPESGAIEFTDVADPGPSARYGVGSAMVGEHVWLFGGYESGNVLNDLWRFSFEDRSWTCVSDLPEYSDEEAPSRRFYHSLVARGDRLYTFGGYDNYTKFGSVHSFCTTTLTWRAEPVSPECTDVPTPRHALWAVESPCLRYMICHGGFDVDSVDDPRLWMWDFERRVWRFLEGPGINARKWYTAARVDDTIFFVGGEERDDHHFAHGAAPFMALTVVSAGWTPETHNFQPQAVRDQIATVTALHVSGHPLWGALPTEIRYLVFDELTRQ